MPLEPFTDVQIYTPTENRVLLSALKRQRRHLQERIDDIESTRIPRDPDRRHARHNQLENVRADLHTCEALIDYLSE
jgi:hypothetical protein